MPLSNLSDQDRHALTRTRLAAIVHSSADAIIGETLDGIITDWNPAAERLYGYTAEEAIGQHLSLVAPPEERPGVEQQLACVRGGESIEGLEAVRWTKDGRRLEVSLTVSPVYDDAGEIVATAAIVRDIAAVKAHERAPAAAEAILRVAFENAPIGMILGSPDGRILRVNHALCEMLGYTTEALLGSSFWAFTHAEDIDSNRVFTQRALSGEIASYEMEKRYIHRDGHIVWGHLSGSLVRDDEGGPLLFISQIENITARKAAVDALAASEERFRIAFADAPIGMALVAADERILQANRALCTMLGYTEAELIGTALRSRTHPDDIPANHALLERVRAGEVESYALEKRYLRKDGQIVWASLTASCVRDETGAIRYFISQIQDITARKRADQELQTALDSAHAANHATRQFLTMMSHELRTPMQAIMGYAELLLAGPEGSLTPEQAEDVQTIRRGATRLVDLVKQMLDLSRLDAGQLELKTEPVSLPAIIEQVRQDVAPQAAAKALAMCVDLPAELPPVLGDAMGIHQILLNLVGNAVKFTDHGEVRISGEQMDGHVAVAVRDTGIGITPESLPHIFEEFRQVDRGMTRRYDGAGLGLTIARRLAERMGGSLSVESQPGSGSTFTLHLPADLPPRSTLTARPGHTPAPQKTP